MSLYEYRARVLSVVDGDTVHLEVDLGFDVRQRMTVRLFGINTPEMNTKTGPQAKAALLGKLVDGIGTYKEVTLLSIKDKREKYGRYLGTLVVDGVNLNEWLVEHGYAKTYLP